MRAQSPLTGLPGNVKIEEEIERRVGEGQDFAILYVDIDHFKSYNDHYGFMRGDQVIQFAAHLLQDVAVQGAGMDAFVGHVGGDDFVVVCGRGHATSVAERIAQRFDSEVPVLYDDVDRECGYIEIENRRGELQRFPLLSVSIGVATTEKRQFHHYAEAVAIATEMKTFTKSQEGSSWAVDRRTD
jgi:diguanylate cyclase (GGDEF)-like protein